jgi:hypothetical protein
MYEGNLTPTTRSNGADSSGSARTSMFARYNPWRSRSSRQGPCALSGTAAEHTAMQVGTHTDVTATWVRGREVVLCQKAHRLSPRHETKRMPGLHAPARG